MGGKITTKLYNKRPSSRESRKRYDDVGRSATLKVRLAGSKDPFTHSFKFLSSLSQSWPLTNLDDPPVLALGLFMTPPILSTEL